MNNNPLNGKYRGQERAWEIPRDGNKKASPNNTVPALEKIQTVSSLTESTRQQLVVPH